MDHIMTVDTYTLPTDLAKAIKSFHTAEVKAEQASLNVAKALYNDRDTVANVGRKALAEAAGVSESRISQWRATGDAIAAGLTDAALIVVNRGTGNGKGRVSSRVLRAALDAVAKGDATAEIASDWVLANALPGDEAPAEDVEANAPEGEQGEAGSEPEEEVDPIEAATDALIAALQAHGNGDLFAHTHDALIHVARMVITDPKQRAELAKGLTRGIVAKDA